MGKYTIIDFMKSLLLANKGRRIWRRYNNLYSIEYRADYFVLLPSNIDEYNLHFFNYIDKCFEARKRVIILTTDQKIEKIAPFYERKNELIVCPITSQDARELIAYYSLVLFYYRFYLISLDEPIERKCSQLIGKKGITAEELIAVGIMGYDSEKYQKKGRMRYVPDYRGTDRDIINFFNIERVESE